MSECKLIALRATLLLSANNRAKLFIICRCRGEIKNATERDLLSRMLRNAPHFAPLKGEPFQDVQKITFK